MSHKRRQPPHDDVPSHRDKRPRMRQKHLYLVLDDWAKGFSIHKIDDDQQQGGEVAGHHHLPGTLALRLQSPAGHGDMSFSALGSKIFAFMNQRCGLVYDPETAALSVGAHAPAQMVCGSGISVAVGDILYVLTYRFFDRQNQHSFEAMSWAPDATQQHPTEEGGGWSWETLPAPPPSFTSRQRVVSYALHPDGSTIFMTTANRDTPGAPLGTYSFSTKESAWRWHGEWALPFLGQAHYDGELDAWVGLHRDGYVCSCQAVSPTTFHSTPRVLPQKHLLQLRCPDPTSTYLVEGCRTTKDKLFLKDRKRYMGASLVFMGGGTRSRFCLVECCAAASTKKAEKRPTFGDHDGCVLRVTMFGLKYNQRGELQTTEQPSTRSFVVSRHRGHFSPVAFWM